MPARHLLQQVNAWLWSRGACSPVVQGVKSTLRPLAALGRDIAQGGLHLRATSLVYTTLLSFAPLLAISFSVLKGIGVQNQMEPFLADLLAPLGAQGSDIAARIVGFVNNIQVGILGAVGVAVLIFSVITLMGQVERALNAIWRVAGQRSFALRLRDYLAVLLVGPLFLFLSVAITAGLRDNPLIRRLLPFDVVDAALGGVVRVVPYLLFMLAFAALFMFMPNTRVRAVPALIAGLLTGLMWKALGFGFGFFVAGSGSYAAIYSAFAALILFMIWLYMGWLVVLAGATLAYYLQNPADMWARADAPEGIGYRAMLAMGTQAVADIGRAFYAKETPPTLEDLARAQNAPSAVLEIVLGKLLQTGIMRHDDATPPAYIPACPFEETTMADLARALAEDTAGLMPRLATGAATVSALAVLDAAVQQKGQDVTLKALATGKTAA